MASDSASAPIPVKFIISALAGLNSCLCKQQYSDLPQYRETLSNLSSMERNLWIPLKCSTVQGFPNVGSIAVCYPLDLIKNRMQVSGEGGRPRDHSNMLKFGVHIFKTEGILGFYNGLSAGCMRQVLYTGTRIGLFQVLIDKFTVDGKPPSFFNRFLIGVVSGAMGAAVGVPADVAMIRMAVDNRQPPEKRRNYKNVFDALIKMYREEGALTWFRGFTPTLYRAIVINTSQMLSYMKCKEMVLEYGILQEGTILHAVCSVVSALTFCTCSLPFDIAKTRIQNMRVINGKPEYTGILHVWRVIVVTEGPQSLWKGFTPFFLRSGPQTIVLFVLYEKLFFLYKTYLS